MGESDAWIGLTFGIDLDTLESNRISPIDFFYLAHAGARGKPPQGGLPIVYYRPADFRVIVRRSAMRISFDDINAIITQEAQGDGSLIAALESIQARFRYLPPEALILVSERLGVPLSQAYSVATFYNAFSLKPKGKHCLHVCMGTACHVRGSPQVLDRLETKLGVQPGGTTRDRLFTLETVNCLGACALGPIVVADGEYAGQMTPQKADALLKKVQRGEREHG